MNNRISPDGKGLEKLVSLIYDTIKDNPLAEVVHDQKLANSYGGKSQFDVIIKVQVASFDLIIAIECKDYKNAVSVSEIHDFKGRCDFVPGISRKIFVAVNGYQSGAKLVAQNYGIELYNLEEISPDLLSGWIIPKSMRLSRPLEKRIGNIVFYTKNGNEIVFKKEDIDKNFFIYEPYKQPTQFIWLCSELLNNMSHEVEFMKDLKSYLNSEWENLDFTEYENEAVITVTIQFNMSDKPFGAVLEGSLQELEKIGIDINYVYEILTPDQLVTRSYRKSDRVLAETLSGVFPKGEIKFEIVRDTINNKTKTYMLDPTGRIIEFLDE